MRRSILVLLLAAMAAVTPLAAADGDTHSVSVGINPLGWVWGSYKIDVGVPLGGLLEIGGQLNYLNFRQLVGLFGVDTEGEPVPRFLTAGPLLRVFPAQNAQGFFIGARMMYLHISVPEADESVNDMTAGVDVGWRFTWDLQGPVGLFFQTHLGVQRWIFGGEIGETIGRAIPILPTSGMHFGVTF